jgi:hypothetical protein
MIPFFLSAIRLAFACVVLRDVLLALNNDPDNSHQLPAADSQSSDSQEEEIVASGSNVNSAVDNKVSLSLFI